jgi:hypothetical protein
MYQASIIINDQNNEGQFSRSFLLKMAKMGAKVIVYVMMYKDSASTVKTEETLYLDFDDDFMFFKNFKG